MLKKVNVFYDEITPLGNRIYRYDTSADILDWYDERNAMYVRKALAFLMKADRDDNKLCESARFDFADGTSWYCEITWEDWYQGERLITVGVHKPGNYSSTPDESYKTDKASLQRRLLARIPRKE